MFKLIVASLLVGLVLAALGVTPADLLARASAMAGGAWSAVSDLLGWAGSYMLLGALVVLPVWLVRLLWKKLSND